MTDPSAAASSTSPSPLGELARLFTRLGFTAFGGPAAHIAMMHDEVVTRRGWIDEQRFVDMIGATSLVPGPNSTEMTMHVGHVRAGWRGLIVAGTCFILPAAAIVLVLAWLYVHYGSTPAGAALLYGIEPVVIAIVAQALVALARKAISSVGLAALAAAAATAWLLGVSELILLGASGLVVLAVRATGERAWLGVLPIAPLLVAVQDASTSEIGLGRLFLVFVKIGAVLYGSGYVLLAFLRTDLVERLQVLTNEQLLDAVAIGQFTPGPVFTTATFIGYVLGGFAGAVVATVAIFLPAFVFIGVLTRILPVIRDRWWSAAILDGVNAAALGLMAGVLGVLGRGALVDPLTVAVAAVAGVLLWRTGLNSAWLIAGGGLVGVAARAAGIA